MTDTALTDLAARIADRSARVDAALEAHIAALPEPLANLHDGLTYGLGLDLPDRTARGKRLRPVLCLLTAETLGGASAAEAAMPFAVGIELMHNFALVHDDIEDGDEVRRHRPAVWKRFGLAHGINIGDYFLVQVYGALLAGLEGSAALAPEVRLRLLALMTDTLDHTHRGQALDMNARGVAHFTMEDYERIVREKTGYYLAAPILGGALVAGGTGGEPAVQTALLRYGLAVGPMFQILDDIIDLTRGKGRGELGSDIKEGKRSFLVAHTAERVAPAERARLFEILDTPRAATTPAMLAEALALFEAADALAAGHRRAEQLHREATAALAELPTALRDLLQRMSEMLLARQS